MPDGRRRIGKNGWVPSRNGCGLRLIVNQIGSKQPVESLGGLASINNSLTEPMKTLKLSVMLALASAVFGATSLSAESPRAAANAPAKSAKGKCDAKGGSCCKKDCKK